jgi:ribonuclease J
MIGDPQIFSRGFVFMREAGNLFDDAETLIREVVEIHKTGDLSKAIKDALNKMFYTETKRRPLTHVFVHEV